MENTVSGAVSQKEPTAEYEENFQKKYVGKDISGSEAQKIIDGIPEENREKIAVSDSSNNIAGAFLGRVNIGATQYYVIDTKTEKGSEVKTYDIGIGLGTPSLGGSASMVILPHANSSKDIAGHFRVIGGSISIFGGEILLDSNNNFMGLKYSIGVTPNAVPAGEVHLGADSSIVRNVENIKVTNEMIKLSKEIEDLSITGESASKNVGRINILSTKLLLEIRKNNFKGDKDESNKIKK